MNCLPEIKETKRYQNKSSKKYYQFFNEDGPLKVDLLTGTEELLRSKGVTAKNRRAYPRPKIPLHARTVNEGITLEENLCSVLVEGYDSSGKKSKTRVFVPHPFTFIVLKLFALRDRVNDVEKDSGRHHALDIFSVLSTMSEMEWDDAKKMKEQFLSNPVMEESSKIVDELFNDIGSLGIIRIKENPYYRESFELESFISILKELFL